MHLILFSFNLEQTVTMRVLMKANGTWVCAWIRHSYGSAQRPAHVYFNENGIAAGGICTCIVGRLGLCAHDISILYQLIHYTKTGNLKLGIASTTQPQQWHKKGKGKVNHYKPVNQVQVKSAKASKEPMGIKTPPVKRNNREKVEEMAMQLSKVEVEEHFY